MWPLRNRTPRAASTRTWIATGIRAALGGRALLLDPQAADRLRALSTARPRARSPPAGVDGGTRPDPADRRDLARPHRAGDVRRQSGAGLDAPRSNCAGRPAHMQAHLRSRLQRGCKEAGVRLPARRTRTVDGDLGGLPSADAYLGLATWPGRRRDLAAAERALGEAGRLEPDNPV